MGRNQILWMSMAAVSLSACTALPDFDLRDLGNGFDTSAAVENLPQRPQPDARGVISYPNYQVVVAQPGDTIATIATRLNLDTNEIAAFNGIEPDVALRRDELIALPTRVAEPDGGPIETLDITSVATTALDRVDSTTPTVSTLPAAPVTAPTANAAPEPIQHKVQRGETVFQISRLYSIPVQNIAEWNGLGSDLTVREGQILLIPQAGAQPPAQPVSNPVTDPGTGTATPIPPSASAPLPEDDTTPEAETVDVPEAPELGAPASTETVNAARLLRPVDGNVIRAYAPGRNEGIDIGVAAGTSVKAADAGTVAAVTTDTSGVAIVVIKHADNLLTVYTNLEDLSVAKNDSVSRGQVIGKVRAGDPSFLHFEVRRGLQSLDPAEFLP